METDGLTIHLGDRISQKSLVLFFGLAICDRWTGEWMWAARAQPAQPTSIPLGWGWGGNERILRNSVPDSEKVDKSASIMHSETCA